MMTHASQSATSSFFCMQEEKYVPEYIIGYDNSSYFWTAVDSKALQKVEIKQIANPSRFKEEHSSLSISHEMIPELYGACYGDILYDQIQHPWPHEDARITLKELRDARSWKGLGQLDSRIIASKRNITGKQMKSQNKSIRKILVKPQIAKRTIDLRRFI